jgi:hypothetical protein
MLHVLPISVFLSPKWYLARSIWHKAHLRSLLYSVTSSLLRTNILLSTLFSKTLNLHSSLYVSDQVSHPYRTPGNIIVLYILTFTLLDSKLEDKRFCTEWWQAFPDFNLLLISSWKEFLFVRVVPKYLNCTTVSKDLLTSFTLPFCPAFWSRDMTIYLVFSAFTSKPSTLLATNKACVFPYIMYAPTQHINMISIN